MESPKSTYRITPRSALQARLQDVYVGQIAATSMAASVLFFMMQMLIPIPFAIITLVAPQMGWIDPKAAETVARVKVGMIEVAAIVFLIHFVRNRVPNHPSLLTESEITQAMEDGGTMALTERQLEIAIAVMACVPLWYLSSGGHNVFPVKIFLLILECFAAMFMTIFLITRWVATKEVRPLGVAGAFLTLTSLWMLIEDLRR